MTTAATADVDNGLLSILCTFNHLNQSWPARKKTIIEIDTMNPWTEHRCTKHNKFGQINIPHLQRPIESVVFRAFDSHWLEMCWALIPYAVVCLGSVPMYWTTKRILKWFERWTFSNLPSIRTKANLHNGSESKKYKHLWHQTVSSMH